MCEQCKGLMSCNVHLCPRASVGITTDSPRPITTLRVPTDAPSRFDRSTPRLQGVFSALDATAKR